VKTFAPWNEINHYTQPTYRKPKAVTKRFDAGLVSHGTPRPSYYEVKKRLR
jgi:hypothetical protein